MRIVSHFKLKYNHFFHRNSNNFEPTVKKNHESQILFTVFYLKNWKR